MRIFIGTFLQDIDCQRISQFQQHNGNISGVKWVKPKKLHMTWSFLGEIEDSRTEALIAAVGNAMASPEFSSLIMTPLTVTFNLWKFWPDEDTPRHFVLEPSATSSRFMQLSELLSEHTAEFHQLKEHLLFRPHVTIARISTRFSTQNSPALEQVETLVPVELCIDRVAVINSHPSKDNDGYQVLKSFTVASQA